MQFEIKGKISGEGDLAQLRELFAFTGPMAEESTLLQSIVEAIPAVSVIRVAEGKSDEGEFAEVHVLPPRDGAAYSLARFYGPGRSDRAIALRDRLIGMREKAGING